MASRRPAPVPPTPGQTLFPEGSLSLAAFHWPQRALGGMGVGTTSPHCQSPAVEVGSSVVSVTNSEGARGRPYGSAAVGSPILIDVPVGASAQLGAAGVGCTAPPPRVRACSSL